MEFSFEESVAHCLSLYKEHLVRFLEIPESKRAEYEEAVSCLEAQNESSRTKHWDAYHEERDRRQKEIRENESLSEADQTQAYSEIDEQLKAQFSKPPQSVSTTFEPGMRFGRRPNRMLFEDAVSLVCEIEPPKVRNDLDGHPSYGAISLTNRLIAQTRRPCFWKDRQATSRKMHKDLADSGAILSGQDDIWVELDKLHTWINQEELKRTANFADDDGWFDGCALNSAIERRERIKQIHAGRVSLRFAVLGPPAESILASRRVAYSQPEIEILLDIMAEWSQQDHNQGINAELSQKGGFEKRLFEMYQHKQIHPPSESVVATLRTMLRPPRIWKPRSAKSAKKSGK